MDYNPDLNKLQMDVAVLQQQLADFLTAQNNAFLPETHYHIPLPFDDIPLNFSVTVSGNQATVVGGYWDGNFPIGMTAPANGDPVPTVILNLNAAIEWICVQRALTGGAPQIVHIGQTARPVKDGGNYYKVLARCYQVSASSWAIAEIGWQGDVDSIVPLPG